MDLQNQGQVARKKSRLGLYLAIIFLAIFISFILLLKFGPRNPGDLGESGLILVIFAIPWIFFIHFPLYSDVSQTVRDILGLYLPVTINTLIIYFGGNFLGNAFSNVSSQQTSVNTINTIEPNRTRRLWKNFNIFFWIIFLLTLFPFLQIIFPISNSFLGVSSIASIAKFGGIIALSYFAYAMTLKKSYILLGLLGLFPYLGLIIGYVLLFQAKKNLLKT